MCHLNYKFVNIFACVDVCRFIIWHRENNASDCGVKPRNQCGVSHHAEAIMRTSSEIHLLTPQLGVSTNGELEGGVRNAERHGEST